MSRRNEGGIPVCNFCGFACIVAGVRQCCEKGKREDEADASLPTVTAEGRIIWSARDLLFRSGRRKAGEVLKRHGHSAGES